MWHHSQNLNERRGGGRGPMWRYGRAWWYLGRTDEKRHPTSETTVGIEWAVGKRWSAAGIEVEVPELGGEHDLRAAFQIPGLALYLNLDWHRLHRLKKRVPTFNHYDGDRTLSFRFHNGTFWWNLWLSDHTWSSDDPKWRRGTFDPVRFLLGKERVTRRTLEVAGVEIPLPEGTYPGTVEIEEMTCRRPRWPRVRRMLLADITVERPPAVPGKGENAWDIDDDAIYTMSTRCGNVHEAVGKYVAAVLRERERYGGKNWKPRVVA